MASRSSEPFNPVTFVNTHIMESCFMAFFALCFSVLFVGKRHNVAVSQLWHTKSLPLIREQFAYVGMEDGSNKVALESTSWSEFTFYASGRNKCLTGG